MIRGYWGHAPEGSPRHVRAAILENFATYAARVFEGHPSLSSAMLAVAQYWADEADDAVHADVAFSEGPAPKWPHVCREYEEYERDEGPSLSSTDTCTLCGRFDWMPFDDNGDAITGFASCCLEGASQEDEPERAYLPYAVARRGEGGAVEVEIIGAPVRAWLDEPPAGSGAELPPVPSRDAETVALFEVVRASPRDDGPRLVLADHLQQRGDPLGEYIALALSPPDVRADPVTRARVLDLEARHGRTWLGRIADVAPAERVVFARGFVQSVAVYFADDEVARGATEGWEWSTVETLRFLPQSVQRLSTSMTALRDVGPLGLEGIRATFANPPRWAIETLHVVLDDKRTLDELATLELSSVRHLTITVSPTRDIDLSPAGLARITKAKWWSRLEELVLGTIDPKAVGAWLAQRAEPGPATLTFGAPSALDELTGFRLRVTGTKAAVDLPKVGARPSFAQVAQMIAAMPRTVQMVDLVPTRWYAPAPADVEALSAASNRAVRVARVSGA